ncbi:MAG: tRNA epoxyqueuosine(34) reductase QueG [Verrucomicrobia bacterium]|nr:tRNA epoxyqueuosine(34) reductase QueG [Verrucomicrobiota bacterium]
MKEVIRQKALELGFDACRFTTALPPDHARNFESWIAENKNGEMAWLERNAHKRVDPQQVLSGAKTLIVLAVSYAGEKDLRSGWHGQPARDGGLPARRVQSEQRTPTGELSDAKDLGGRLPPIPARLALPPAQSDIPQFPGVVARYAQFTDYHDVFAERLKTLTRFVDELAGNEQRSLWYVDTGPLLERDLAQRAGLGFVGKHTNLISRQLGNWIFLSEIITTTELPPDEPEKNRCGSCARCISACPTAAIVAPFDLDARRCISYLTIELKGAIPVELRPLIGDRIYGCDDCLAACPWNKFAQVGSMMAPNRRDDLQQSDLIELLSLDGPAFKKRFAGTPIVRTKRRGLLRNVCVALGNIGNESALPALERAATDPEPLISEHAQWAIREIERRMKATK